MFTSIRSRLALSFAAIALLAAVCLGAILLVTLERYYSDREIFYLKENGGVASSVLSKMMTGGASEEEVQSQIDNLAALMQVRLRIYDLQKQLLYDSGSQDKAQLALGALKQRLSVQPQSQSVLGIITSGVRGQTVPVQPQPAPGADATGGDVGQTNGSVNAQPQPAPGPDTKPDPNPVIIYRSLYVSGSPFGIVLSAQGDSTGDHSGLTFTQPLENLQNGATLGILEMSEGPAYGLDILKSVAGAWALASLVAVVLAAAIGWLISRRISAPVVVLAGVTARMAAGDLSSRAPDSSRDEFGKLGRSFNEMASQVEQTVTALRRFVSDAAHELHTPLTALHANLDLAADEETAHDRQVHLQRAQEMVKRLEVLSNNLLDLSRLEANGHGSNETLVDVAGLLKERGEVYASQAEQAGLALDLQVPSSPAPIRASRMQTGQAIDNLVENACKFTPAGGTVGVRLALQEGQVVLSVSDTGIGIPEEDLAQLFNRFHRGRNATGYAGSGLGLAIVKAIMDQEHGQVTAENVGRGARFTLRWPSADLN